MTLDFDRLNEAEPEDVLADTPEAPPIEDDPAEALLTMSEEIDQIEASLELGAPIVPCEEPWIAIDLDGGDGFATAYKPYTLTLPDGTERKGTLDRAGALKIPGHSVDLKQYALQVRIALNESQAIERYVLTFEKIPPKSSQTPSRHELERLEWTDTDGLPPLAEPVEET